MDIIFQSLPINVKGMEGVEADLKDLRSKMKSEDPGIRPSMNDVAKELRRLAQKAAADQAMTIENDNTLERVLAGKVLDNEDERRHLRGIVEEKQASLDLIAEGLQERFPQLEWRNAAKVTWRELTSIDGQEAPGAGDIQKYGGELNQWNYWINQMEVRKSLLILLSQLMVGNVRTEQYENDIKDMHRILLVGEDGNRWYWPETLIGDRRTDHNVGGPFYSGGYCRKDF